MRVLHLTELFPIFQKPHDGIFIVQQIKEEMSKGWEVHVAVPMRLMPPKDSLKKGGGLTEEFRSKFTASFTKEFEFDGIKVHPLPYISFPRREGFSNIDDGNYVWYFNRFRLINLTKQFKPDILQSHFLLPCGQLGNIMQHHFGIVHACMIHENIEILANALKGKADNLIRILCQANGIVANSGQTHRIIFEHTNRSDICKVPMICEFKPSNEIKVDDGKVRIVGIGYFAKFKGFKETLYSLKTLRKEFNNDNWEMRIVGSGPLNNDLLQTIEDIGLSRHVFLQTPENHEAVLKEIKLADIFMLLTLRDTFGIVFIEALANGCAVIGSKYAGAITDLQAIDRGAVISVDPHDYSGVAKWLNDLIIKKDMRDEYAKKGFELVSNFYRGDNFFQTISSYYADLLTKCGGLHVGKRSSKDFASPTYKREITFCFTMDYEVVLTGRSGRPDSTLINPAQALMDLFSKWGIPTTVFVDSLYLATLRAHSTRYAQCRTDLDNLTKQLVWLSQRNNQIALHIHSSWLNAKYDKNIKEWILNRVAYRLHDIEVCEPHLSIDEVVNIAINELELIESAPRRSAQRRAFRMGGLCIEPFHKIAQVFHKKGFTVDSSVAPNMTENTDNGGYDYRRAPRADLWRFATDPMNVVDDGEFLEIPISTGKCSIAPRLRQYYRNLPFSLDAARSVQGKPLLPVRGLKRLFDYSWLSPETLSVKSSIEIIESCIASREHYYEDNPILTAIIHPKVLNRDSLHNINNLIDYLKSNYRVRFCKLSDIIDLS